MSNSTTTLDTISSSQASKEITANALFDAGSPATLFGNRATTTAALSWGYYGGRILVNGVLTTIANGVVALTASLTNYVEATPAGVVSKNTTAFTPGSIPLYTIVAGASTITSYTDERTWVEPSFVTQRTSIAITTADVTLTAAQARTNIINLTGALTGTRSLIVPVAGIWNITNNTTGAFDVLVKTSAGVGVTVPQGGSGTYIADGTNVIPVCKGNRILKLAMTDANTTLTVQQASSEILEFTGALTTVDKNIVLPLGAKQYTVYNNTTGGFNLNFIGATGTGVLVAPTKRAIIYADGTNIVRVTADT
jgi:hypothetical protein